MKKHLLMLASTLYSIDARIRHEAETLVSHGYNVKILVPRENEKPGKYKLDGVEVQELNITKYQGKSNFSYLLSYIWFTIVSSLICNSLFLRKKLDVTYIHNMPNFLVFARLILRLFGTKMILDTHDSMPETYSAKIAHSSSFLFKIMCWEEKVCCKLANRVICVNHPQKDVLTARNIPVIAPRLQAIQYYFSEEMIAFFDPENVDSLADAIYGLYENLRKWKSQVKEAGKFIEKCGWENHQSDLINLYKDLLGES